MYQITVWIISSYWVVLREKYCNSFCLKRQSKLNRSDLPLPSWVQKLWSHSMTLTSDPDRMNAGTGSWVLCFHHGFCLCAECWGGTCSSQSHGMTQTMTMTFKNLSLSNDKYIRLIPIEGLINMHQLHDFIVHAGWQKIPGSIRLELIFWIYFIIFYYSLNGVILCPPRRIQGQAA